MKKAIGWISGLAATLALGACSGTSDETTLSQAEQAIQIMEEADAEAVQTCEAKAAGCLEEHGDDAQAACDGLTDACTCLEGDLAQVREQAVACWEKTPDCQGENCSEEAGKCQAMSGKVAEVRGDVVECGEYVQACMVQAAESADGEKVALCGELKAACSAGVATKAQEQVQVAAQGDVTQAQAVVATETQTGEALQEQQQACLTEVEACGEAAGSADADLTQLRSGEGACALGACGALAEEAAE